MAAFPNPNSNAGLKKLDEHLLTRYYITGHKASKDDITVYAALSKHPPSQYVNVSRWYNHIETLLGISGISSQGSGVSIDGLVSTSEHAVADSNDGVVVVDNDNDQDVDLIGEDTQKEKKSAEEKATSTKKKFNGQSSALVLINPNDEETDMKKLEETVRSIQVAGLFWGASKLLSVGYGIKLLGIECTAVGHLVHLGRRDNAADDDDDVNLFGEERAAKICNVGYGFKYMRTIFTIVDNHLSLDTVTRNTGGIPLNRIQDRNNL
ncbi:PREDICTED: elongation factor 1-delta 1-like [Brassica oleracea var. oleracea]|uniref:elongation factor 1-delta 1-like n=1 Tax=Brassica oleracea var. oleracea TaxID=109376 RepID=UPI0006A6F2FD|nr:PREDICTED: elongation factor 1-delta 1-like [Brassica oleracea var. oleracea]